MIKDVDKVNRYLTIAKGQLDGILRMIEDERYCLDISDQISATMALLKKTNNLILKNHADTCVRKVIENGDTSKVEELLKALEKQI